LNGNNFKKENTMKSFIRLFVLSLALTGTAFAADEASKMTPEMQEKMQKAMSPNENHKIFEGLVGKWTYTSQCWMDPSGKPETSTGTSENTLIYGGRFLKSDVKGTWMNQPFEGVNTLGYDNGRGEYVSTWVDSMATGIMLTTGQYDAASKTLNLKGTCACPITGDKNMSMRTEWKVVDADHNTYTMYATDKEGKETKGMEIVYTRAA
jgi:hypothetical protein